MKANDYSFGNYLYERRKRAGLSQTQLAGLLGVTNKAVSKWENGRAKPTTDVLRRLAALFETSVEDLLILKERRKAVDITKIVITGGPCAGKTTGMSWIRNAFSYRGYRVLFVPRRRRSSFPAAWRPGPAGATLTTRNAR